MIHQPICMFVNYFSLTYSGWQADGLCLFMQAHQSAVTGDQRSEQGQVLAF